MEAEKRSLMIYGAITVASIVAISAGVGGPGIPLLMGAPWVAKLVNDLTSSAGINLATGFFQNFKKELPTNTFLKNEDLHKAVGRTIGAVIRNEVNHKRLNPGWTEVAKITEWEFESISTSPGTAFAGVSEENVPGWMLGDLDTIQGARPLTSDQWRTLIDVLASKANLTDEVCLKQAEYLAQELEKTFSTQFFNLITSDPHCKVALEKMIVLLLGAGFQKLETLLEEQNRELAEIKVALGPALELTTLSITQRTDSGRRFHYTYQLIPFVGRYKESKLAKQFLDQPDRFGWTTLIAPSGSGKSRFAQELALYAKREGWHAGFLEHFTTNWQTCTLDKKTLVIIDDLSGNAGNAAALLKQIQARKDEKIVRVLLLQRQEKDPLLTEFQSFVYAKNLTDFEGIFDPKSVLLAQNLTFSLMDERELKSIILSIFESQEASIESDEELERILAGLQGIAKDRPLYTSFAAHACANGQRITDWSQEGLTSYVIVQEMDRWKGILGDRLESALNLLTWATLTDRPQSRVDLAEISYDINPGDAALVSGLSESDENSGQVTPLYPQPIGELFVLLRLSGNSTVFRASTTTEDSVIDASKELVKMAWQEAQGGSNHDDSKLGFVPKTKEDAMRSFIVRSSENFPVLAYRSGLTTLPPDLKERDVFGWSLELKNLCQAGNSTDLQALLDRAAKQIRDCWEDSDITAWVATLADPVVIESNSQSDLCKHAFDLVERTLKFDKEDWLGPRYLAYLLQILKNKNIESTHSLNTAAARLYRKAIELNPQDMSAHNNLANLLNELAKGAPGEDTGVGDNPAKLNTEAAKLYRRAIEINPQVAEAHHNLGALLTELTKGAPGEDIVVGDNPAKLNTEAANLYRRTIEINPQDAEAHCNLAYLLIRLAAGTPGRDPVVGDDPAKLNTEAASLYRRAIEINPQFIWAHLYLAVLLTKFALGDPGEDMVVGDDRVKLKSEAIKLLREGLAIDPQNVHTQRFRDFLAHLLKNRDNS